VDGAPDGGYRARGDPMRSARTPIDDLRRAIALLPERTRVAMLEAVRSEPIITGGYARRGGGVCPMLGAHRRGGRTDLLAFARAWDRFTGARRARPATAREVLALEAELEASLSPEAPQGPLAAAIAAHQALGRRRREAEAAQLGLDWLRADRPDAGTAPPARRTRETGAGAP
jgi:hypothetical protein